MKNQKSNRNVSEIEAIAQAAIAEASALAVGTIDAETTAETTAASDLDALQAAIDAAVGDTSRLVAVRAYNAARAAIALANRKAGRIVRPAIPVQAETGYRLGSMRARIYSALSRDYGLTQDDITALLRAPTHYNDINALVARGLVRKVARGGISVKGRPVDTYWLA